MCKTLSTCHFSVLTIQTLKLLFFPLPSLLCRLLTLGSTPLSPYTRVSLLIPSHVLLASSCVHVLPFYRPILCLSGFTFSLFFILFSPSPLYFLLNFFSINLLFSPCFRPPVYVHWRDQSLTWYLKLLHMYSPL